MSRRYVTLLPGLRLRWRPRAALAVAGLLLLGLLATSVSVATGHFDASLGEVGAALSGGGGRDPLAEFVVAGLRAPRAVAAAATGAALGLAGAIFQAMARNPLASPDLVGFTTGSAAGALTMLLIAGATSAAAVAAGAIAGGLLTAALVMGLAFRAGAQGQRLVLIGLAIAAMLASVNDFLLTRADLERAQAARVWLFGSLNGVSWPQAATLVLGGMALAIAAFLRAPSLKALELGEETAAALGVAVGREKRIQLLLAVALTGLASSVAGPIGFVALAAPQLGRLIARAPGISLAAAAATGALMVLLADLAAQRLLAPAQVPVGLFTGAIGGAYLAGLLAFDSRRVGAR